MEPSSSRYRKLYVWPCETQLFLVWPANFEIPCMALSLNFNDPYDTTVSFGP
jgi:hypothetical protein